MSRPNVTSVDLGPVAAKALDELTKRYDATQSTIIRRLIQMDYTHNLLGRVERLVAPVVKSGGRGKTTDEERRVIDTYKEVFNLDKRIFYPPALAAIRKAVGNGLSHDELCEIVRVAGNDQWVAQLISRGQTPQLHMLLGEKMIANLWDAAQEAIAADNERHRFNLEGTVKPAALRNLKELLTPDQYSVAWDMIRECMNEEDVKQVVAAATEQRWEDFARLTAEAEALFDEAFEAMENAGD